MSLGKIGLEEGLAAMGAIMAWAGTARDPGSDGGVGITVNEALDLVQDLVKALGFNAVVIGGEGARENNISDND